MHKAYLILLAVISLVLYTNAAGAECITPYSGMEITAPGVYSLCYGIYNIRNIWVRASNVTIDGNGAHLIGEGDNPYGLYVSSPTAQLRNITIKNFYLENFYAPIRIGDAEENVQVLNNTILNFQWAINVQGHYPTGGKALRIADNHLNGTNVSGEQGESAILITRFDDVLVEDNIIDNADPPGYYSSLDIRYARNILIRDNHLAHRLLLGGDAATIKTVLVENNSLGTYIYMEAGDGILIRNNTFLPSTYDGRIALNPGFPWSSPVVETLVITDNQFAFNNSFFSIPLIGPKTKIFAENNYWGTTDYSELNSHMRAYSADISNIDFCPYRDSVGIVTNCPSEADYPTAIIHPRPDVLYVPFGQNWLQLDSESSQDMNNDITAGSEVWLSNAPSETSPIGHSRYNVSGFDDSNFGLIALYVNDTAGNIDMDYLYAVIQPKPVPVVEPPIIAVYCGNGKCEQGENYANCPQDCAKPPKLVKISKKDKLVGTAFSNSKRAVYGSASSVLRTKAESSEDAKPMAEKKKSLSKQIFNK